MVLLTGAVSYFAQASDLGWSISSHGPDLAHQVFYARYLNWAVSFPSLALALGMLSGISWTTILTNMFLALFWVVTYLAAAYTTTSHKWGFFAFGTFSWVIIAASTLNESREAAQKTKMARDYMILAGLVNLTWLLYPVAFAVGDGAGVLGITGRFVFVGVLDVVQMVVSSCLFLVLSRRWNYAHLHLDFSEHRFI